MRNGKEKHFELKKKFLSMIEESRGMPTEEEISMLDLFLSSDKHTTVDDFMSVVREQNPDTDRRMAKRFLELLVDYGIARRNLIMGQDHYEHFHLDEHHDHMVCLKCGNIDVFQDDAIEVRQVKSAMEMGFSPLMHCLEIRGICSKCKDKLPKTIRLTKAFQGEVLKVLDIHGGKNVRHYLLSLGLTPGTEIKVSHTHGKFLVLVRGSRIALGRGMATKIEVERLDLKDL